MPDKYSTETPVLDPPLEPGEGRLINIVADYAKQIKESHEKGDWAPLIEYLNSAVLSESARKLGLYMLGEMPEKDAGENVAKVAEWYISAVENEKRLSKVLFKSEFAEPRI